MFFSKFFMQNAGKIKKAPKYIKDTITNFL